MYRWRPGKMNYKCAIFDLDGVLVDTAKYHYLAWKELADELGFQFTKVDNERLKGVSRMTSLHILLEVGQMEEAFTDKEKQEMADRKNKRYVEFISKIDASEVLDGVFPLLEQLKERLIKITLGSASKNAGLILEKTGLKSYFDVIIDGNDVEKVKPDPEVFTRSADALHIPYEKCVVFEDSQAGIAAAKRAQMMAVGIGEREHLPEADVVYQSVARFEMDKYFPGKR